MCDSARLANWMSFRRPCTSQMLCGSSPCGSHRRQAKISESQRGLSSSTTSIGVFEYRPPSQYGSPSMRTAPKAGASALRP
ncbi:hypothetical protein Y695_01829 [Hydrogenophaga sp. T4]|nr:hypothetical protein Y695_01829 [Hydrogenophaga sp. T4]